jgi:hypothetical protein
MEEDRSTLTLNEPHPAFHSALQYLGTLSLADLALAQEALASCAIEGNRLGEVCSGTIHRLLKKQPVSDRYLLGLAWTLKYSLHVGGKNGLE